VGIDQVQRVVINVYIFLRSSPDKSIFGKQLMGKFQTKKKFRLSKKLSYQRRILNVMAIQSGTRITIFY